MTKTVTLFIIAALLLLSLSAEGRRHRYHHHFDDIEFPEDLRIWRTYEPIEVIDLSAFIEQYQDCDVYDFCQENLRDDLFNEVKDHLKFVILDAQYPEHLELINSSFTRDFGGIVSRTPELVFIPTSTQDVRYIVKKAYKNDWELTIKGGSGNPEGATMTNTLLLDMSNVNSVRLTHHPKTVVAGAGATIQEILGFLHDPECGMDFRIPVIPDYSGVTIGGVCSIGGVGPHSAFNGAVVDTIKSITVVTNKGKVRKCSATRHTDLFNSIRSGMGQFGVITEVELPVIPNSETTRLVHLITDDEQLFFDTYTTLIKNSPISIDGVQSFVLPADLASISSNLLNISQIPESDLEELLATTTKNFVHFFEITIYSETPTDLALWNQHFPAFANLTFFGNMPTNDWDNRLILSGIPFLKSIGVWGRPNIWLNIFYTETEARTVIPALFDDYDAFMDLGFGFMSLYAYPPSVFTTPFFSTPETVGDELIYLLVLGKVNIPGTDANAMLLDNRNVWDASPNATVYPTNIVAGWNSADWQKHFGDKWSQFAAAKTQLDPNGQFADNRNFNF